MFRDGKQRIRLFDSRIRRGADYNQSKTVCAASGGKRVIRFFLFIFAGILDILRVMRNAGFLLKKYRGAGLFDSQVAAKPASDKNFGINGGIHFIAGELAALAAEIDLVFLDAGGNLATFDGTAGRLVITAAITIRMGVFFELFIENHEFLGNEAVFRRDIFQHKLMIAGKVIEELLRVFADHSVLVRGAGKAQKRAWRDVVESLIL